jgi:hypothetical protein
VSFSVTAHEPVPFMRCYCSICRKTAGTGGYAINLGADHGTLKVKGKEHLSVYQARLEDGHTSTGERNFCKHCGTALWLYDPTWPELVHPHAGAVDTPLSKPPDVTHMMLGSKPDWVDAHVRPADDTFDEYPKESLAEWHRRHRLES